MSLIKDTHPQWTGLDREMWTPLGKHSRVAARTFAGPVGSPGAPSSGLDHHWRGVLLVFELACAMSPLSVAVAICHWAEAPSPACLRADRVLSDTSVKLL